MQAFDFLSASPSGSDAHWRVPQNTAKTLILSASQDVRAHASIFNNSDKTLYLKFGNNVGLAVSGTAGLYTVRLGSASYFELPKPVWQGEIWGAWDSDVQGSSVAGSAMVLQIGRAGQ